MQSRSAPCDPTHATTGRPRLRLALAMVFLLSLLAAAWQRLGQRRLRRRRSPDGAGADASACPVDALDDADGPVEITIWHAWIGLTAKTLDSIAADYNASQDKVVLKVEAQGTYEEVNKYQDAIGDPTTLPTSS